MTDYLIAIGSHIETSLWVNAFIAILIKYVVGTHDDTILLAYLGTDLNHKWC